jgi:hypothetical protein
MAIFHTFQRRDILTLFDETGLYQASWDRIEANGHTRLAYEFAVRTMEDKTIACYGKPPVWAWEMPKGALPDLAESLYSDFEKQCFDYVMLSLDVPDQLALRSSYHGWCDLYFDCLESGQIDSQMNADWLDWRSADIEAGDAVQVMLPFLRKDWIIGQSALSFDESLMMEQS